MTSWEVRPAEAVPSTGQAVGFVALVAVLYFVGGALLLDTLGEPGIAAAEWLFLLGPAVLFVGLGKFDLTRTFSLRRPPDGSLLAAAVLSAGAIPLGWLIGWVQSLFLPVPAELVEALDQLVTADSPQRFLWLLFMLAATPAVCEEAVFRGVLLAGSRPLDPWRAIALNGLVFGLFHLSLETVVRFLPTAYLGVVIAWAVWRTGSIFVGMLMHFLNNAAIVLVASLPVARDVIADPQAPPPPSLVVVAVVCFAVGVHLLRRPQPIATSGSMSAP